MFSVLFGFIIGFLVTFIVGGAIVLAIAGIGWLLIKLLEWFFSTTSTYNCRHTGAAICLGAHDRDKLKKYNTLNYGE